MEPLTKKDEIGRAGLIIDGKYMEIKDTPYCWEGLLDTAITALKEVGLSWTANMIKDHLPELKETHIKYLKMNSKITREFHRVIELTKDVNLNNLDEVDRERLAIYRFCKDLLNEAGSLDCSADMEKLQ